MKKHKTILASALGLSLAVAMWVSACQSGNTEVRISDKVHYDEQEDAGRPELEDIFIQYDSITYSDDSWSIFHMHRSPKNTLMQYYNKAGQLQAAWSLACESYAQFVVLGYDEKERLSHLIVFDEYKLLELGEAYVKEWIGGEEYDYLTFRRKIDKVDFSKPDTLLYNQINIEYNENNQAVKVYDTKGKHEIVAPEGYILNLSVEPCVLFWENDISGGEYLLKTEMVPLNTDVPEYYIKRFVFFFPSMEQIFKNGRMVKSILYPDISFMNAATRTMEYSEDGNKHIYTMRIDRDENTYITIWENNRMQTEEVIAPNGDVLKKTSYQYKEFADYVDKIEEELNYSGTALEFKSEKTISVYELPTEEEMMNLLRTTNHWENYYKP